MLSPPRFLTIETRDALKFSAYAVLFAVCTFFLHLTETGYFQRDKQAAAGRAWKDQALACLDERLVRIDAVMLRTADCRHMYRNRCGDLEDLTKPYRDSVHDAFETLATDLQIDLDIAKDVTAGGVKHTMVEVPFSCRHRDLVMETVCEDLEAQCSVYSGDRDL